jgi:hypothetical protein
MTTTSQRDANRRNAKSSTGPRTAKGKARASRGALKHGLNLPIAHPEMAAAIEAHARMILGESSHPGLLSLARAIAEAQLDLNRVRRARHTLLSHAFDDPNHDSSQNLSLVNHWLNKIEREPNAPERFANALTDTANNLTTVDRYERRALSRRNSAIRAFDAAMLRL